MTRSMYKFALFFNILITAVGMCYGAMYFQLGEKIMELPYYPNWFILNGLLSLIAVGILLKYFEHKKFKHALTILIATTILLLFHLMTGYTLLLGREWGTLDQISYLTLIAGEIVWGAVLAFSNSGTQIRLRRLGIALCIFLPVVLVLYILAISTANAELQTTIGNAFRWLELIASFLPIFYILLFLSELNNSAQQDSTQLA